MTNMVELEVAFLVLSGGLDLERDSLYSGILGASLRLRLFALQASFFAPSTDKILADHPHAGIAQQFDRPQGDVFPFGIVLVLGDDFRHHGDRVTTLVSTQLGIRGCSFHKLFRVRVACFKASCR